MCRGDKKCIKTLVGKPEEQTALGRRRRTWEDVIKVILNMALGCGLMIAPIGGL